MPESSTKTYSEEEYNKLADQLAQLQASMLGQELLKFRDSPSITESQGLQGVMSQSGAPQSLGGLMSGMGGGQQATRPGQLTIPPQGFGTLPGAGTFAPQGVMFAGGSPWPVDPRPTNIYNSLYGLNQALQFLQQSGLLDKLRRQPSQPGGS